MKKNSEHQEKLDSVCRIALQHQYEALVQMIRNAIEASTEDNWTASVKGIPFWHIAYHTIFYLDLYSGDSEELKESFQTVSFANEDDSDLDRTPSRVFTKTELLNYLDETEQKCIDIIKNLDAESLARPTAIEWKVGRNVLELLFENLRHLNHHIGQLHTILRYETGTAPGWIGRKEI